MNHAIAVLNGCNDRCAEMPWSAPVASTSARIGMVGSTSRIITSSGGDGMFSTSDLASGTSTAISCLSPTPAATPTTSELRGFECLRFYASLHSSWPTGVVPVQAESSNCQDLWIDPHGFPRRVGMVVQT